MEIRKQQDYRTDAKTLQQILASEELAQARFAKASSGAGATAVGLKLEFSAVPSGAEARAANIVHTTTKLNLPAQSIPAPANKFLRRDVAVTIEAVHDFQANQIHYTINVTGAPVSATAHATLTSAPSGTTTLTYTGSLKVNIPFVGGKAEQMAAGRIDSVLEADRAVIEGLLTDWER